MLWFIIAELSGCLGVIALILYGLFSLKTTSGSPVSSAGKKSSDLNSGEGALLVNLHLIEVYFFSRLWPAMLLLGYANDLSLTSNSSLAEIMSYPYNNGLDILLVIVTMIVMRSFKGLESVLLILLAFVGQLFMLHSCDLVSFYICLEAQNFCFLVLCGLQPRALNYSSSNSSAPVAGVEASLKYLLLSGFSSGVLLFWFSKLYLFTGVTHLSWGPLTSNFFDDLSGASLMGIIPQMLILLALMFKLGGAPLHIWMIDIYSGVKRQLLMYLATAPKLSLFGFWLSTWHSVWTDFTVFLFVIFSMIIGSFGAYNQPTLRSLFAYSTVNEIGLMLMALETAGFHSLLQHLTIYIVTMLLLWNISDKRVFSVLAISLAGMPPLAGFFGKAWIFYSVATIAIAGPYLAVLIISLFCTGLSLVYYLRVFRLFTMSSNGPAKNVIYPAGLDGNSGSIYSMAVETRTNSISVLDTQIKIGSFCLVFLVFGPLLFLKPFVL